MNSRLIRWAIVLSAVACAELIRFAARAHANWPMIGDIFKSIRDGSWWW